MNIKNNNLSVIIVSYERPNSLKMLLQSLLNQKINRIDLEVILINNSKENILSSSKFTKVGRLIHKFKDLKIINSSHNWGPGIRYIMALTAKYQNILFLDDDIYLTNDKFIQFMLHAYEKLRKTDILTCWAELWTEWSAKNLTFVPVDFMQPSIKKIVRVDYCGTGICMFNKKILYNENILKAAMEYNFADTAWFPWLPSIIYETKKYYFPSTGMLKFHEERKKNAICLKPGYDKYILKMRKKMIKKGYKPVLSQPLTKYSIGERIFSQLPKITKIW